MLDPSLFVYLAIQVVVTYAIYKIIKHVRIESKFARFVTILAIASTTAITSIGPIGLILGLPSIVITSALVSILLDNKVN
jgi:hypothetical protein